VNNGQGFVADCIDCHLPAPQDTLDFFYQKTFHYDELWHHEGRRARFGAAMMAPDYTWWHGFYECKKRYNGFMEGAEDLIDHNKKAYKADLFPKATGKTERPKEIFK
jgi:hydroxylamine dehydrogenase